MVLGHSRDFSFSLMFVRDFTDTEPCRRMPLRAMQGVAMVTVGHLVGQGRRSQWTEKWALKPDRCSREVGKSDAIWTRGANRRFGMGCRWMERVTH